MTSVVRPCASSASDFWIALGLGIERRGRFVEDQDRRVLQEHARDRQPLLLAAGQFDAALADDRVQPGRQARYHARPAAPAGRHRMIGLVGGAEAAIGDVLADRAAEQEDVLLHDADLAAQRGERHVPDIDAVDGDRAGADLVEARQQRADGGLAGAGRTDEGDGLAGVMVQRSISFSTGLPSP
jgi:predicted amidohydrolase